MLPSPTFCENLEHFLNCIYVSEHCGQWHTRINRKFHQKAECFSSYDHFNVQNQTVRSYHTLSKLANVTLYCLDKLCQAQRTLIALRLGGRKKSPFFSGPATKPGAGGKGPDTKEKITFFFIYLYFSPKIVEKFFLSKSVSGYFKTKKTRKKSSNGH